ncbi:MULTISPECIES: hypothetical protein [Stenotrophomonas]|uniref:hypothetical protein n=1 Tax=Stenotrophomonas TaxID=40323 RepID=UPI000C25960D|nr:MULTISPECIES: hypothetical protein [Stenotrophomonas]MBA0232637.1 hypothetical protein [Stenotrophomonas maltophilia]MBA0296203.1 hypothetical protein [Stenotrophomonas maltophilia]MBA0350327.1 hypothetical protein [Stenotrophomonas maltophilia]MBA0417899.1 hypothetical protein [Stenotrophomonas maltophilia]MBH1374722.1 hypothetical protein [Stenotrophomonas maltophilia]
MLDLVTTSFYLKAPLFDKSEFELYSTQLFDEWESYVDTHLNLPDYSVSLVVEEGSIKGLGKIAATVGALYIGIGNYGGFVSGVQTIREQATYVANALFDQAKQSFGCKSSLGNSKHRGGEVYYLKGLFDRVQVGQISSDQAVAELRDRWGQDAENSPELLKDLARSLAEAPRHPEQLHLLDGFLEPCEEIPKPIRIPKPRPPRPPELPIPQHYRIEISRQRKGGNKKVSLTRVK